MEQLFQEDKLRKIGLKLWNPLRSFRNEPMDDDQVNPALGARGRRRGRQNVNVEAPREVRQAGAGNQIQPQVQLPAFVDALITRNWTLIEGLIGTVIKQRRDVCVSICMCRLMQALYNRGRAIAEHLTFCVDDLDTFMVDKTDDSVVKNLNIVFRYAFDRGLLKKSDTRRRNVGGPGLRIHAHYEQRKEYTGEEVYAKANQMPIAICLETKVMGFSNLGHGIYEVPGDQEPNHAVLVVGVGETRYGMRFLVIQNSWGENWGNGGYGRIHLKSQDKFKVFWAEEIVK